MSMPQPETLVRPWRTATIVASTVAAFELVLILILGVALLGKPLSERMRDTAQQRTLGIETQAKPKPKIGSSKPQLARGETSVLILNGNGVSGAAHATAARGRGARLLDRRCRQREPDGLHALGRHVPAGVPRRGDAPGARPADQNRRPARRDERAPADGRTRRRRRRLLEPSNNLLLAARSARPRLPGAGSPSRAGLVTTCYLASEAPEEIAALGAALRLRAQHSAEVGLGRGATVRVRELVDHDRLEAGLPRCRDELRGGPRRIQRGPVRQGGRASRPSSSGASDVWRYAFAGS